MPSQDRLSVLNAMMEQSVIPVFYHPDVELCTGVIRACAKADPSVIMGIGSNMITKKLLDAKDYKGIEDKVRSIPQLVKRIKAELAGCAAK